MDSRGNLILPFSFFREVFIIANISEVNVNGSLYDVKHKLTEDFENHWSEVLEHDDPSTYPEIKPVLLDLIYPVGSIYWSKNATNPSNLFGGTWVQIKDRFILAAGSNYKINTTGGSATHKLTASEMPSHTHGVGTYAVTGAFELRHSAGGGTVYHNENGGISAEANNGSQVWNSASQLVTQTGTTDIVKLYARSGKGFAGSSATSGSDQPHNNMPPYVTAYCWERTA